MINPVPQTVPNRTGSHEVGEQVSATVAPSDPEWTSVQRRKVRASQTGKSTQERETAKSSDVPQTTSQKEAEDLNTSRRGPQIPLSEQVKKTVGTERMEDDMNNQ